MQCVNNIVPCDSFLQSCDSFLVPVTKTVSTNYTDIRQLCVLEDGSIVIGGVVQGDYKLTKYDVEMEEITSRRLQEEPQGMTFVFLKGQPTLAVSYR